MAKDSPKEMLDVVRAEDVRHDLPDLHYTAIVTLPVIDALLICAGLIEEYETPLALPSRRNGRKLYVRAAAGVRTESLHSLRKYEPDFHAALKTLSPKINAILKAQKKKQEVAVVEYDSCVLPVDCIIGHCAPYTRSNVNLWTISKPVLLPKFYNVEGRGGFFFIREIREKV